MLTDHLEMKTEAELVLVLLGDFIHKPSGAPHENGGSLKLESDMGLFCPEKQLSVNHFRKIPFYLLDPCSRGRLASTHP